MCNTCTHLVKHQKRQEFDLVLIELGLESEIYGRRVYPLAFMHAV